MEKSGWSESGQRCCWRPGPRLALRTVGGFCKAEAAAAVAVVGKNGDGGGSVGVAACVRCSVGVFLEQGRRSRDSGDRTLSGLLAAAAAWDTERGWM